MAHRARADRHERTGEAHAGEVPTVSFDYVFTKSDGLAGEDGEPDTITALVVLWTVRQVSCLVFLWREKSTAGPCKQGNHQVHSDVGPLRSYPAL